MKNFLYLVYCFYIGTINKMTQIYRSIYPLLTFKILHNTSGSKVDIIQK